MGFYNLLWLSHTVQRSHFNFIKNLKMRKEVILGHLIYEEKETKKNNVVSPEHGVSNTNLALFKFDFACPKTKQNYSTGCLLTETRTDNIPSYLNP